MTSSSMHVTGIIAEYDPVHNGHIYHLGRAREEGTADFSVVVMSGDFTQRGEPALLDKWHRAEAAVRGGADLVLELPYVFATSSAEYFAEGGVKILRKLGVVDSICFGAEGDPGELSEAARILKKEPEEYRERLHQCMDSGMPLPAARQEALSGLVENPEVLSSPNNILAVEYLKAIGDKGDIKPIFVKRLGPGHGSPETGGSIASGSAVRRALREGRTEEAFAAVPETTGRMLEENKGRFVFADSEKFFELIRAAVLSRTPEETGAIFGCVEGLENRLLKYVRRAGSREELIESAAGSRYTKAAVSRLLLHILTGFRKTDLHGCDPYVRVLGAGPKGRQLLRIIKENDPRCDIISAGLPRDAGCSALMRQEIIASDIYNILSGADLYECSEFVKTPVIL
ncbi:MAG: nucleotidyltransferase family protein [Anaerovoracaceae bacterium]